MPSNKASGADNQQERLKIANWIVGFVDGEGCFTVSIFKNEKARRKLKWQVFPEFVVSQSAKNLEVLKIFKEFFGCGLIVRNKRYDNHNEDMYRYCVRNLNDLKEKIIPFFDEYPLKTTKRYDFEIFKKIIALVDKKEHLKQDGLEKINNLRSLMNRKKKVAILSHPQRPYAGGS